MNKAIAWYVESFPSGVIPNLNKYRVWYVAQVPGDGGVDWGYEVNEPDKAVPLSPYWQRRFRKDCEFLNRTACFREVKS